MTLGSSLLVATDDQPRVRRATDAMTVVVGAALLTWGFLGAGHASVLDIALDQVVAQPPPWSGSMLAMVHYAGTLLLFGELLLIALRSGDRREAIRDVLLAMLGAAALFAAVTWVSDGAVPQVLTDQVAEPATRNLLLGMAVLVAGLIAASPYLARPLRRVAWVIVPAVGLATAAVDYSTASAVIGSIGIGMIAAGVVLLMLKSPGGYPDTVAVSDALSRIGLEHSNLHLAEDQTWGVRRLVADGPGRLRYDIKAYGRDATDAQRLSKLWHGIWLKVRVPSATYSRLLSVEHEALVTLMAGRAGASVPGVIAAAEASDEVALLVTELSGVPLSELPPAEVTDELLERVWSDLAAMHTAGISHGGPSTCKLRSVEGVPVLTDFLSGSLVADDTACGFDVAEMLFSLSGVVGAERAVSAAEEGLGRDRLVAAMPYLQLPAVSLQTRSDVEDDKALMSELREVVAARAGVDLPKRAELRRISVRSVAMAVLLIIAAYAIVPMLADIDFAYVMATLEDASWAWIAAAFAAGQLVYLTEALSTSFAAGTSLPLLPTALLQVSTRFVGLAVPTAAGRVALGATYLRGYGIDAAQTVTLGLIDSLAGLATEAAILLLGFLALGVDVDLSHALSNLDWLTLTLFAVLIAMACVVAIRRVRRLRDLLLPMLDESRAALAELASDPRRGIGLVLSNLVSRLLLAATLWMIVRGLSESVSLGEALLAVVVTGLLAGVVPVPGGIGVAEATMTASLALAGMPDAAAFAAAVVYRIITYYTPSVAGFFTLRWLQSREYL